MPVQTTVHLLYFLDFTNQFPKPAKDSPPTHPPTSNKVVVFVLSIFLYALLLQTSLSQSQNQTNEIKKLKIHLTLNDK